MNRHSKDTNNLLLQLFTLNLFRLLRNHKVKIWVGLVIKCLTNTLCLSNATSPRHNGKSRKTMRNLTNIAKFINFAFTTIEFHPSTSPY